MKLHLAFALTLLSASAATAQVRTLDYSYDALGRPTRVAYDNDTEVALRYDATGNPTRKFAGLSTGGGGGGGGGGCFIATAAWGSSLDPHVGTLRDFRERRLRPYALGRAFIAAYEQHSPPLAAWIAERPTARLAARWMLTPFVLALVHPQASCVLIALAAAAWWARRRRTRRSLTVASRS